MKTLLQRTYLRAGRLTPANNFRLRSRAVSLPPGSMMPWHSTREREELLLVVRSALRVEIVRPRQQVAIRQLQAGQSLWLPSQTIHRVVNTERRCSLYVYVTG